MGWFCAGLHRSQKGGKSLGEKKGKEEKKKKKTAYRLLFLLETEREGGGGMYFSWKFTTAQLIHPKRKKRRKDQGGETRKEAGLNSLIRCGFSTGWEKKEGGKKETWASFGRVFGKGGKNKGFGKRGEGRQTKVSKLNLRKKKKKRGWGGGTRSSLQRRSPGEREKGHLEKKKKVKSDAVAIQQPR